MYAFDPASAALFLKGAPTEFEPRLVDEITQLVATGSPHHYRRRIRHHPEMLLALTQRLFRAAPAPSLDYEAADECGLSGDQADRADNVGTVFFEYGGLSEQDGSPGGDTRFADAPPPQLAPVNLYDIRFK